MSGAAAAPAPARSSVVTGDTSQLHPTLLARLRAFAIATGRKVNVTSGGRTTAEQTVLWNNRASNPYPVAPPGTSMHEGGFAADVTIDGVPIQKAVSSSTLIKFGLYPQSGDAVHVQEFPQGTSLADARKKSGDGGVDVGDVIGNAAGTLPTVGPLVQGVVNAGDDAVGAVGDAGTKAAGALVDALGDALGLHADRIALYVLLIGGAVVLLVMGVGRAAGVTGGDVKTAATIAATRGKTA